MKTQEICLEITPNGVKEKKKTLKEFLEFINNELYRIKYIIGSEIKSKIFDKSLGIFWLLTEPIITAFLYYFLTVIVFKSGIEKNQFLFIYVAVVFWRWFSRSIDNSPAAITGYGSILKQTNFSITSVIFSYMGTEIIFMVMSFTVLIIFLVFHGIYPNIKYIFLPIIFITQFFFCLWLVLIFSVIGAFFKDLVGILYAFTSIWWYLSPGIYPVSLISPEYRWLYDLNPFVHIIPAYRDILIYGKVPQLIPIFIILIFSIILSVICLKFLNKARYYFFMFL